MKFSVAPNALFRNRFVYGIFVLLSSTFLTGCDGPWYEPESCTEGCLIVEGQVLDVNRGTPVANTKLYVIRDGMWMKASDTVSAAFSDDLGLYRFSIPYDPIEDRYGFRIYAEANPREYFSKYNEAATESYTLDGNEEDVPLEINFELVPKTYITFHFKPVSDQIDYARGVKVYYNYNGMNERGTIPLNENEDTFLEASVPAGQFVDLRYLYYTGGDEIWIEDTRYFKFSDSDTITVQL